MALAQYTTSYATYNSLTMHLTMMSNHSAQASRQEALAVPTAREIPLARSGVYLCDRLKWLAMQQVQALVIMNSSDRCCRVSTAAHQAEASEKTGCPRALHSKLHYDFAWKPPVQIVTMSLHCVMQGSCALQVSSGRICSRLHTALAFVS